MKKRIGKKYEMYSASVVSEMIALKAVEEPM
jgi:hypothetical protein